MEKVKLPKEICYLLDKAFVYYKNDGINRILWSCIQAPYYNTSHEINELRHFTYKKENATLIAKAILFGYEPEEKEEESKERVLIDSIVDYLMKNKSKYLTCEDYENVAEYIFEIIKKKN